MHLDTTCYINYQNKKIMEVLIARVQMEYEFLIDMYRGYTFLTDNEKNQRIHKLQWEVQIRSEGIKQHYNRDITLFE